MINDYTLEALEREANKAERKKYYGVTVPFSTLKELIREIRRLRQERAWGETRTETTKEAR
jgi:hypothetical protein